MRGLIVVMVGMAAFGCGATRKIEPGLAVPLAAGMGQEIAQGFGGVPCSSADQEHREAAIDRALHDAVERAASVFYGELPAGLRHRSFVDAYRLRRYWADDSNCFASVDAVVDMQSLQKEVRGSTRGDLVAVGRPRLVFAVESFRILSARAAVSRRHAAEPIDALQSEFISRGFDVYRSHKSREGALGKGEHYVADAHSLNRERIERIARADGVRFLVQGELKVSDRGQEGDRYLAVVDGSIEIVDLETGRVVASYVDNAPMQHLSASAAYTGAIAAYARAAAATLAPQMIDVLRHVATTTVAPPAA